uniref:Uncharacterized protein n=1 Tax=Marseillevirus LCMAC102 TaxID=2506603 RepID=A0A481YSK8_9VIRU|nr:MAG: hypothetical protein LCMAC102_00160 [Marseillevirus LCMAC102]
MSNHKMPKWEDYHSEELLNMSDYERIALHSKSYRGQVCGECIQCHAQIWYIDKYWDGLCGQCGYCDKCGGFNNQIQDGLCVDCDEIDFFKIYEDKGTKFLEWFDEVPQIIKDHPLALYSPIWQIINESSNEEGKTYTLKDKSGLNIILLFIGNNDDIVVKTVAQKPTGHQSWAEVVGRNAEEE